MANQFMTLSLFIVLLSFFIVLNSIAKFDDTKASVVSKSVTVAFSNKSIDETTFNTTVQSTYMSDKSGDTLTDIEGLFKSQITGVGVQKNRLGTVMHIKMSVPNFESAINNANTPLQNNTLIPTLVTLMQLQDTLPYMMDVFLNTQDDTRDEDMIKAVAGYTDALEELGVSQTLINAGVKLGEDNTVELIFRRYIPFTIAAEDLPVSEQQEAPIP